MSSRGCAPLFFLGRRLVLAAGWFYAVVTGLSVALMISVIREAGFVALAVSVTASQLIIMTIGWLLLSGYLMVFTSGAKGKGGEARGTDVMTAEGRPACPCREAGTGSVRQIRRYRG